MISRRYGGGTSKAQEGANRKCLFTMILLGITMYLLGSYCVVELLFGPGMSNLLTCAPMKSTDCLRELEGMPSDSYDF